MEQQSTASQGAAGVRWTIGRKLGLAFAALAVLLIAIGAIVSIEVGDMTMSTRRVLEEQRETTYSRELLRSLESMQQHLALRGVETPFGGPDREVFTEWLEGARLSLDQLEQGPRGTDPSELEHAQKELELYADLGKHLDALRNALASADPGRALPEPLAATHAHAEHLHAEMTEEASESREELAEDGRNMRLSVAWITLAALGVLGLVVWMVNREIVRPIRELQSGAARIARGDLSQRVPVTSRDEIGDLAREFNGMALELEAAQADLEQRVRDRTSDFVRAARLAGLGTLAAGVAHEINNPLASIAACADGLERKLENGGASPQTQREYLQIIAKEAYRAHEITSRLLEFARSDTGAKTSVSAPELLRDIGVLLEHRLKMRGLTLDLDCDAELPPLRGNPSECKQVLLNLIHNAIDASPEGGRVRVTCAREQGEVCIEVEDQGPGIPSENLERIFDPFFTTKPPGKGTGLGLAIAHRIVEGHGGKLEVENTGHGARFRVRLPTEQKA